MLPASLDPLQFAYRSNRSTDDAIAFTLHTALSHLENKNTYVRMLFVDYSSAFNTIVPVTLVAKLQTLGLNRSLCSWILDFLTGRSQVVRMGNNTSSPLTLNTGALQGCVLSPLLYTHDCTATHSSNVIVKFADDTTVIGLITDNDETAYREEVSTLTKWCQENHLSLNIDKTKELVVDYRRQRAVVGLMDRALDLKPEVNQGCGFESWLRQEVHDCSPGAAQSAAHCSKCVHLDGLNAENTFHSSLYSV